MDALQASNTVVASQSPSTGGWLPAHRMLSAARRLARHAADPAQVDDGISCRARGDAERPLQACRRAGAAVVLSSALLVPHPVAAALADSRSADGAPGSVPSDLLSSDKRAPSLGQLLNGPKRDQITNCTRKCMPACIRGGEGAPGLGPLTLRKDLVKFKDGFRTRAYCLSECTQVCAASITGNPAAPVEGE